MENNKSNLSTRPFGMRDKLCYACGDIANDFTFMLMSSWMLKFYTDIMGVSAMLVGGLMASARIVDAFTDVGMGTLVDMTDPNKSKYGKFRVWMLRGCVPCAFMGLMVFGGGVISGAPMPAKIVWMFVTYLLWGSIFYTCVNIPYGSMASAITSDPAQRTSLSSARSIGAIVANLGIGVVGPLVVYITNDAGNRVLSFPKMMGFAAMCAVLAVVFYMICIFGSVDRVYIPPVEKQSKENKKKNTSLISLLTDKALLLLIIGTVFMLLTQMTQNSMAGYIYPNYFGNTTAQAIASMAGCMLMIVIAALAPKLAKKFGKRELGMFSMFGGAIVYALLFILHVSPENVWVYMVLNLLAYAALGAFSAISFAMIIDVIDNAEVKTGNRDDGKYYGVYSFARKLGQALSSLLAGSLLTLIGYSEATAFETAVVNGIYNVATLVPAIGFTVAGVFMVLYPMKKSIVDENAAALAARRDGK
ncbi:MAG: glycoside-pentoside-hexuronide (GPH):cation symporter [Lachnospiraceae bacterium]|nr:glycoside-pentoside-hexuronide (GPH):cation symporter [Lachnospiraceae bacterium]